VMLLRYNLEKQGFRVCEAADGEEALVQIAERKPTLCCSTGCCARLRIEVCSRIRRSPETRGLPVIIADCARRGEDRWRGLDSGADDYVVKPSARASSSPDCAGDPESPAERRGGSAAFRRRNDGSRRAPGGRRAGKAVHLVRRNSPPGHLLRYTWASLLTRAAAPTRSGARCYVEARTVDSPHPATAQGIECRLCW